MKCPHDDSEMDHVTRHGVGIDHCPVCGGVWLDKGELDHLLEAVRPAVELENPDPAAPPLQPATEGNRGKRYKAQMPKRAVRFEDRGEEREPRPGSAHRYGGRHSRKTRRKDLLEEIFDFD